MGEIPPHHVPSLLCFWKRISRIWSIIEFEGFPVYMSQALGVYSHPLILGSSGTIVRTLSKWVLKSSTEQFVRFLTWIGNELNNFGPCIWKEFSRRVLILELEFLTKCGTLHILPSLGLDSANIPQFGTKPSITFHTYIMRYLSSRLCCESICSWLSLFQ